MARLDCHTDPMPTVALDPGRLTITITAHPMRLAMDVPEAGRLHAELGKRLAQARGVNGAAVEVSEA